MKNYLKGILTGFLIAAVLFAIPALAENIDALFNSVRINVNGVDEIQWGENIKLNDGGETPSSILYNGTTYLPMRKLGELSGQQIYWNGDSNTVSMTGKQKDINVIAEKPDKNGNVWEYYTFTDENDINYLAVKDKARGYERVYQLASEDMRVTDDEIYFLRHIETVAYRDGEFVDLVRLSFDNDENTQDGEQIYAIPCYDGVVFYGDYIFFTYNWTGFIDNQNFVKTYNCKTGEIAQYKNDVLTTVHNPRIEPLSENEVYVIVHETYINYYPYIDFGDKRLIFDMSTDTFRRVSEEDKNAE